MKYKYFKTNNDYFNFLEKVRDTIEVISIKIIDNRIRVKFKSKGVMVNG